MNNQFKILCIVGARPNFMKMAPILEAFKKNKRINAILVHTGQHFDASMSKEIFHDLMIQEPDHNLQVGSGSHAEITAKIMLAFETVLKKEQPNAVLVVGDVDSTLACALVAVKEQIPVIHVEAGLRSFDRTMPEEINRILTDQMATLLFTTEQDAARNLSNEGITERVHFVGNVMVDTLYRNLKYAISVQDTLKQQKISASIYDKINNYAILTLHRPSNVDNKEILQKFLLAIKQMAEIMPVIFPVHPRTHKAIEKFKLDSLLDNPGLIILGPLSYLSFLGLMKDATIVLTDSGGIQEETTALGIPCFTLRDNTERPITITEGTNTLVGTESKEIMQAVNNFLKNNTNKKTGKIPKHWDGHAADRICVEIIKWLESAQEKNNIMEKSTN